LVPDYNILYSEIVPAELYDKQLPPGAQILKQIIRYSLKHVTPWLHYRPYWGWNVGKDWNWCPSRNEYAPKAGASRGQFYGEPLKNWDLKEMKLLDFLGLPIYLGNRMGNTWSWDGLLLSSLKKQIKPAHKMQTE